MLMEVINGTPEFDGHSIDVQEFSFLMLAAHAQLATASSVLGEVWNLYNMLVRGVSAEVRADVRKILLTSVHDIVAKLKAGYAGARRPVAWTALKLFRMRRESDKTPQQFAYRLDAVLRTLKERAVEEWGATEAAPRVAAHEEASLEAGLVVVDDDKDDVQGAREEREWTAVRGNARHATTATLSAKTASAKRTRGARTSARVTSGSDRRNHSGLSEAEDLRCGDSPSEDICGGEGVSLSIEGVTAKAYVLDWGSQNYQATLGADALRSMGARLTTGSGGWRVKVGNRRFGSVAVLGGADYVGAAVVRSPDAVNPRKVREKFRGVFYVEGDPIPATRRVVRHIDLNSDRPVYVKTRRYPQASFMCLSAAGDGIPRYRAVVDFHQLNKRTRTERYPLP
ncbi:hypothetical protein AAG570_014152 [Ranatra chinensis]|uniref:Uncharacterized protein n=1 Tax=Ranatra chinensis TaxID=642074 RepID=A0ABD0Y7B2_9HEMI